MTTQHRHGSSNMLKKVLRTIFLFSALPLIHSEVPRPPFGVPEFTGIDMCDLQCEALCQETENNNATKNNALCERKCRHQLPRSWVFSCENTWDCPSGYCSLLMQESKGGFLPPKATIEVVRDPVTKGILLHWDRNYTTNHTVVYGVQWNHQAVTFKTNTSKSPQQADKQQTWTFLGWTINNIFEVVDIKDPCLRPSFRVAAVSRFGSRWFTKPVKTPEIIPGPVRDIRHGPYVYANGEVQFTLYYKLPEGWPVVVGFKWSHRLDQPCLDSGQGLPVFMEGLPMIGNTSIARVRLPGVGVGCKFVFQIQAFSRCKNTDLGPPTPFLIDIKCNEVRNFNCPKTPYNPPGNVGNISVLVVPAETGHRLLLGWVPPTDMGSVGVISTYYIRWGILNMSSYDPFLSYGELYNTQVMTVAGNKSWIEFSLGNSTGNDTNRYGIQIMATAPGHSLHASSWMTPVKSVTATGDEDEWDVRPKTYFNIPHSYEPILKDDTGVVIALVPEAKGVRVYVTQPDIRASKQFSGFNISWAKVNNTTDGGVTLLNKNSTFLHNSIETVLLNDLEGNTEYGVEVTNVYNANLGDFADIVDDDPPGDVPAEEPVVHYFTMPDLPEPKPEPSHPFQPSSPVTVVVIVVVGLVVLFTMLMLFLFKRKGRKKLSHLQQRWGRDDDTNVFYFDFDHHNTIDFSRLSSPPVVADKWELPHSCLKLGNALGTGAFGMVVRGQVSCAMLQHRGVPLPQDSGNGIQMTIAVKLLQEGVDGRYYNDFIQEINLMKKIGYHQNVVSMLGCCTLREPICLVVEHMPYGDLLHYLKRIRHLLHSQEDDTGHYQNREVEHLTPLDLLSFARQIAKGMEFLSSKSFVHRDLAARNILVGEDKILKIGDFGLTRYIYDDKVYVNRRGGKLPMKWMSVEAIFDLTFSTASDVWSYGIVLFELVTLGGTPYPGIANRELLKELWNGYRMTKPDNCSDEMYHLMKDCWKKNPEQRPSFVDIWQRIDSMISECTDQEYLELQLDATRDYYLAETSDEEGDEELAPFCPSQDSDGCKQDDECLLPTSRGQGHDTAFGKKLEVILEGDCIKGRNLSDESQISVHSPTEDVSEGCLSRLNTPLRRARFTSRSRTRSYPRMGTSRLWNTSSVKNSKYDLAKPVKEHGVLLSPSLLNLEHDKEEQDDSCSQSEGSDEVFFTSPSAFLNSTIHETTWQEGNSSAEGEMPDVFYQARSASREIPVRCFRTKRTTSEMSTTSIDSGLPQSPTQVDYPGLFPKYSSCYGKIHGGFVLNRNPGKRSWSSVKTSPRSDKVVLDTNNVLPSSSV